MSESGRIFRDISEMARAFSDMALMKVAAVRREMPCAMPPLSVRVEKVVLVQCQRGEGDSRRDVLQIFHLNGDLLAEHDRIHEDPEFASYHLRETLASAAARKGGFAGPGESDRRAGGAHG
ncbi:hypothetical protein [Variovorax paradoxus]|uniref:hypothetical protein n=1 Tax=Variovorax paradoxus TaxID=34073 RepID=UPI003ED105AA